MPAKKMSRVYDDAVGIGEDTMVVWPGSRRIEDCGDLRPVIFAHGYTGGENAPDFLRLDCLALIEMGMVILSGDFGGSSDWGNDDSISKVADTLTYGRANGWCSSAPALTIGFSMGNLTCLNWARINQADIVGHIAVVGAFDLTALHADNFTSQINSAYGGSYSEATYGAEHNPVTYAASIEWLPVITYYSEGDTVVDPADEAEFASAHGNTTRNAIPGAPPHGGASYASPVGYLADAAATFGA